MTTISKTQIGLLITAVVLFVLLFLAPKTHTGKLETKVDEKETMEVVSLETFITMATKSLKPEEKTTYDALVNTAKNSKVDTLLFLLCNFGINKKDQILRLIL
jgi:hypothetical protein